jgi:RNA polymerase sigma factor (sigma-70 family)
MNKSEILKQAWKFFRNEKEITFSLALKKSWAMYKSPESNPDSEFRTLYNQYHNDVYNFIRKYFPKDLDTVEQICNDAFINVRDNLHKFNCTKSQIKTWIINIAKNLVTDYYRANKRRKENTSGIDITKINKAQYNKLSYIEDNVQKEEIKSTVNNALDQLNDNQRKICELVFQKGMKYKEAAEMLGISLNMVRVSVNRSRKILQSDNNLKNCHMAMYN